MIDTAHWAPVLDILELEHRRRGHQGPVAACVMPECKDAMKLLEDTDRDRR